MRPYQTLLAALLCLALPAASEGRAGQAAESAPVLAGWIEDGWIGAPAVKVKVKLDTGAQTSSIHAASSRAYERDGLRRVRFTLINHAGDQSSIDRPVLRTATIRRAGAKNQERPVIRLEICVAGITAEAEFTLTDRSGMTYPVLLGRAFLADRILVDSGRIHLASGLCPKP